MDKILGIQADLYIRGTEFKFDPLLTTTLYYVVDDKTLSKTCERSSSRKTAKSNSLRVILALALNKNKFN